MWIANQWGPFLAEQVGCVCIKRVGREHGQCYSEEPLGSKYDINSAWGGVRSNWSSVSKQRGITRAWWTADPSLAAPRVSRFSIESCSHCLPTFSFCVGCLFFEKLTQDHSCNVSFY